MPKGFPETPLRRHLNREIDGVWRRYLDIALIETGRNVSRAARLLSMSRKNMQLLMIKYDLREK